MNLKQELQDLTSYLHWQHQHVGRCVVETFRAGQTAQLPLEELVVHYPGLKITAREMRGGAIVFLSAPNISAPTQQTS